MTKSLLGLLCCIPVSLITSAQLPSCPQQPGQIPNFSGTPVQVNPANLSQTVTNDGVFTVGEVFRYTNAVTVPRNISAYLYVEAVQNATLVNFDNNGSGVASRFQPTIRPNPDDMTTATQEGWVQFRIEFRYNGGPLNLQLVNLAPGLQFRHLDIDGYTRGTTGSFRETGWATGQLGAYFLSPTDLTNAGTVSSGGFNWIKILGQTTEHDGPSSDPNVTYISRFGTVNTIRFRMGYLFTLGNGGVVTNQVPREYVAEFGCFDLSNNIPLPVKLTGFAGAIKNDKAILNWETAEEINFSRFEIERSSNGVDYSTVGVELSNGGPAVIASYEFPDDLSAVNGSVFYYRLKMIDMDAVFTYSPVVLIKKENGTVSGITIFPNPVISNTAQVKMSFTSRSTIELRIVDLNGRILAKQIQAVYSGNNSIPVRLPSLQTGTYLLQAVSSEKTMSQKFTVIR